MNSLIIKPTINFTELVKNDQNKLPDNYQSKLVDEMKKALTEKEQRWYVANLHMYLNYDAEKDYPINLDDVFKIIGFANKGNAKRALENNFTLNEDYKITIIPKDKGKFTGDKIMLNTNTFKNLCMITRTPEGKAIQKYYIKLENIHNKINDENMKEQFYKLENNYETKLQELTIQKSLDKQNILLSQFHKAGSLVYIIKVKSFDDGKYIIKIGESRDGITGRWNEFKTKYGIENMSLINCFLVNNARAFEGFLHSTFSEHKVTNWVGHEREKELFLIGNNLSLKEVMDVIDMNIQNFRDTSYLLSQKDLQIEKMALEIEKLKSNKTCNCINDDIKIMRQQLNRIEANQNKHEIEPVKVLNNFNEPLKNIGLKLLKINPETFSIIETFTTIGDCVRRYSKSIARTGLENAIKNCSVYRGYRWKTVDEITNNIIIEPTKITRVQNVGYIAKLNKEKTKIINIYLDRKSAAILNNCPCDSFLDNYVKNSKMYQNHFYQLYDTCDTLKEEYNITSPILYKDNGIGQFNENNQLIAEFKSKKECRLILKISEKVLTKAVNNNLAYNGSFYRALPDKLVC